MRDSKRLIISLESRGNFEAKVNVKRKEACQFCAVLYKNCVGWKTDCHAGKFSVPVDSVSLPVALRFQNLRLLLEQIEPSAPGNNFFLCQKGSSDIICAENTNAAMLKMIASFVLSADRRGF